MPRIIPLVALTALVLGPAAVRSEETPQPRKIIDRAIEAAGGEKALQKHNAATWKEKGTYYGMGQALPYTAEYAVHWPDKFKMEVTGIFTTVLNGEKGWVKNAGQETREMTPDELKMQRQNHYVGWVTTLLPLKEGGFTLSLLEETKVEDRPALGVRISRKERPDVKLYFDKKTGLLVKSESRTHAPELDGKEVTSVSYYKDYRKVDGALVPAHIVMKRDGKDFVDAVNFDLKAHGELEESVFAKP